MFRLTVMVVFVVSVCAVYVINCEEHVLNSKITLQTLDSKLEHLTEHPITKLQEFPGADNVQLNYTLGYHVNGEHLEVSASKKDELNRPRNTSLIVNYMDKDHLTGVNITCVEVSFGFDHIASPFSVKVTAGGIRQQYFELKVNIERAEFYDVTVSLYGLDVE